MGYILNGKYYKGKPTLSDMRYDQQTTYKLHEMNRQRKDYAREIVQPHLTNGDVNPKFIEAYPDESKDYGFLPSDKDLKEM